MIRPACRVSLPDQLLAGRSAERMQLGPLGVHDRGQTGGLKCDGFPSFHITLRSSVSRARSRAP